VKPDWERLKSLTLREIEATLAELPPPLREQAQSLPITLERLPNIELQSDGIDAESLGLFSGAEFADDGGTVLPAHIMLFIGNLWNYAGNDEEIFRDEIRTTFLHELGHFFGLDEDDLMERGLE